MTKDELLEAALYVLNQIPNNRMRIPDTDLKDTYQLASAISKVIGVKPKIILICGGGVIHEVASNTEINIINLDYDVFHEPPKDWEDFDSRDISGMIDYHDEKEFEEVEKLMREEWNNKLKAALNHDDKNENEV